jgi:nitroimidazol reductase NimA-like FMN-containing flavoprotein (pyridoxamine 5'-phosphate oxidase superfamily)
MSIVFLQYNNIDYPMGALVMRRKEFAIEAGKQAEVEAFLSEMSFGFLGTLSSDGWPHITPLNFVYFNGCIYFHGSKIGQKMEDLKHAAEKVTFCVAKEYAIIPSYYSDPKLACPATAFFKSVSIQGSAVIVVELEEKAAALSAFMEKLQPEGGYDPITTENPAYISQLKGVSVVKIEVQELTAKFKFGQNWNEARHEQTADLLHQRNHELDKETVALMKKFCPHHKDNG